MASLMWGWLILLNQIDFTPHMASPKTEYMSFRAMPTNLIYLFSIFTQQLKQMEEHKFSTELTQTNSK